METLPSKEVVSIDIPLAGNFDAEFQYNYFVTDERVSETGGIKSAFLERPAESLDSKFIEFASTRAPRFVRFSFVPAKIYHVIDSFDEQDARENNHRKFDDGGLIRKNYDKIMSEDELAHFNFVGMNFQDVDVAEKAYVLLSSSRDNLPNSVVQQQKTTNTSNSAQSRNSGRRTSNLKSAVDRQLGAQQDIVFETIDDSSVEEETSVLGSGLTPRDDSDSLFGAAKAVNAATDSSVSRDFITRYTVQPERDQVLFFDKDKKKQREHKILNDVVTHVQLNAKFAYDLINNSIFDPMTTYSDELVPAALVLKNLQESSRTKVSANLDSEDFKTEANYISVKKTESGDFQKQCKVVGYVIDKLELLPNGGQRYHKPVIIDSPHVHTSLDFKVKYGSTYAYTIKTIVKVTFSAIASDTNDLVLATCLVASKPSHKRIVVCHETVPPPPPVDVNLRWDYENDKMVLMWAFPPNSQQDVKHFLIFRRDNANEAFQLLALYDFDDSEVKTVSNLDVRKDLIRYMVGNPRTFFTDHEFNKHSHYVYAVATIDAHGMVSDYSEQFAVSFDRFKNVLVKKRVSASGAPLSYPNMHLDHEGFVDTIRDRGHRRVRLSFHPEFLSLEDNNGRVVPVVATDRTHGSYRFQFINTDVQKMQVVNVSIEDRRTTKRQQEKFGKDEKLTERSVSRTKT